MASLLSNTSLERKISGSTPPESLGARPTRYLLAASGVSCVGLAAVGVVVPGLPTTVFLIMAVWCFTRSCPWMTERLVRNRFFHPFLRYLEPGVRMPLRAKVIAITLMWTAITLSCSLVIMRGVPALVSALIAAAGIGGTWCISRQGRAAQHSDS